MGHFYSLRIARQGAIAFEVRLEQTTALLSSKPPRLGILSPETYYYCEGARGTRGPEPPHYLGIALGLIL